MKRMGRPHRPFYRISAVDSRVKRDGKVIENLGWYDPMGGDPTKQVALEVDRIKHWLSKGAQPSDTVKDLLAKHNLVNADERKAEHKRRAEAVMAGRAKVAAHAAASAPKEKKEGEKKEEAKA